MFAITCSSERLPDGRFQLLADENWRLKTRKQILLDGPFIEVWDQLLALGGLSHESQRAVLQQMGKEARTRLIATLTAFRRGGLVEFEANDGPPSATLAQPRLIKLHLELTHRCNFRCAACYLGARLQRAGADDSGEGTTDQWLQTIREAAELGCSFATVTGGEPFVRRDLLTLLEALSDHGIISEINTNASPITPEIAARLSTLLISGVSVTLYGYDESSAQQYSGNAPGYLAAMRAVHSLAEARVPVNVKYFTTRDNVDGFARVKRELEPLGIELSRIGHTIHADIFDGEQRGGELAAPNLPHPQVVQDRELPCHPTGRVLNIEPDGRIRACPKIGVHFGNVFRDGLRTVWEQSSGVKAFRAFWVDYCQEEGFVQGSRHGSLCPASAMLSKPNGLSQFRSRWQTWQQEEPYVQIGSSR